jgi:copper chaperone
MVSWQIDNVKCGGCARRIRQRVAALAGVSRVSVDVDAGTISFDAADDVQLKVAKTLATLGYPRSGSVSGVGAVAADVRSVVSCTIGRLQSD